MTDPVFTLAKSEKAGSKTIEILEFLIQKSNLSLLFTSDTASFLKLQKKLCSRKVNKRVKNLFRSCNMSCGQLKALADLALTWFKDVSLENELLVLMFKKVRHCQKHKIIIELFSLVWLCLEIENKNKEKADEQILSHIRNLRDLDVGSRSNMLVNSSDFAEFNAKNLSQEEKFRKSFVDYSRRTQMVQVQSNFNSKFADFDSIVETTEVFDGCLTFENLLPMNHREQEFFNDDNVLNSILSKI